MDTSSDDSCIFSGIEKSGYRSVSKLDTFVSLYHRVTHLMLMNNGHYFDQDEMLMGKARKRYSDAQQINLKC